MISSRGSTGHPRLTLIGRLDDDGVAALATAVEAQVAAGARQVSIGLESDSVDADGRRAIDDLRIRCALRGAAVRAVMTRA